MKEKTKSFTKTKFNQLKEDIEKAGFKVITNYRKGLKKINLAAIVLEEK